MNTTEDLNKHFIDSENKEYEYINQINEYTNKLETLRKERVDKLKKLKLNIKELKKKYITPFYKTQWFKYTVIYGIVIFISIVVHIM